MHGMIYRHAQLHRQQARAGDPGGLEPLGAVLRARDAQGLQASARGAEEDARDRPVGGGGRDGCLRAQLARRRPTGRQVSRANGQSDRVHGVRAGPAPLKRSEGARRQLARVSRPLAREDAARAGRALHGLRRSVLPHRQADGRRRVRLPDQQPDPRVERSGLPRAVARGAGAAAQDQQLPRVDRPRLSGAVRGVVRARHQRAGGHHQEHRVRDRRPRLRRGLDRPRAAAVAHRERRSPSSGRARRDWRARRSSTARATR